MRDGICFEKENVVANDMQSATTRSEWRDLSAFSSSVKTEDQPVFELAVRLATGKPDFKVQVPHQRKYPDSAEAEPGYLVGVAGLEPAASWSRIKSHLFNIVLLCSKNVDFIGILWYNCVVKFYSVVYLFVSLFTQVFTFGRQ